MRRLLVVLVLLLSSATASAEKRSLQDYRGRLDNSSASIEELRKANQKTVRGFGTEAPVVKQKFPWGALGLAVLGLAAASPLALKLMRSTRKDLSDLSTFGLRRGEDEEAGRPS